MSQNPNNSTTRQEVNKILEQHFADKKDLLTPKRSERPAPSYTPKGAFKSHYGSPKKAPPEETKTKLEELDKATQGKIHEKTEGLPDWVRNRERKYADKIIKEGSKEDLRDVPKSQFIDETAKEKTPDKKDEPKQNASSNQVTQAQEESKSDFVSLSSKDEIKTQPAGKTIPKPALENTPVEQPNQSPEEGKQEHDDQPNTDYDDYVNSRQNHSQSEQEKAPDEYQKYINERNNEVPENDPDKGKEQQKEHEFDER